MSIEFRPAVRRDVPLLIFLAGGSGSGKTESALRLATGLSHGEPFAVIDTEHGRALHKADDYRFEHAELTAPFTPERYAEAIRAADLLGPPVIVLDSGSHEYEGEGGVLEIQLAEFDRLGRRDEARMLSWAEAKRRHKIYRRDLLRTRAHVIVCHRAEDKIEIAKDDQGKTVVRPARSLTGAKGWIPICERRLPFEATISLLLLPDAPGVPVPIKLERRHEALVPLDAQLDEDTGRRLAAWAAGGETGPAQGSPTTATSGEKSNAVTTPPADTGGASEERVEAVLQLARDVGGETARVTAGAIAEHRDHYGLVDPIWLDRLEAAIRSKRVAFPIPESAK